MNQSEYETRMENKGYVFLRPEHETKEDCGDLAISGKALEALLEQVCYLSSQLHSILTDKERTRTYMVCAPWFAHGVYYGRQKERRRVRRRYRRR